MVYLNTLNNIAPEKVELFRDFSISLTCLIEDTYLGDDVMEYQEDQINHFNWCWEQNIKNFGDEYILFQTKGEHYYYYLAYYMDIYYGNSSKTRSLFMKIVSFWDDILAIDTPKTKSDHDMLCEIYKIMDKYFINNY